MSLNSDNTVSRLCYIAPYCEVLKQYHYDVSEEYLLGMSRGLNFEYSYIHNNRQVREPESTEDWISIVGSKSEIGPSIANRYGIEFLETAVEDKKHALELCKEELNQGRYIIAFLDTFSLKHYPQYQNTHGQTNIIIKAWNSRDRYFSFCDKHVSTIPISTYEGFLSENELTDALIIGENPYSGKSLGLLLNRLISGASEVDICEEIRKNAEEMLKSDMPNRGINGIVNLANEIEQWLSFWPIDSIQHILRQGYHHATGRGGPAISREVYADFLSTSCNCHLRDLRSIEQGFVMSSRKWKVVGAKFFRGSIKFTEKILLEISDELRQIASLEATLFQQLFNQHRK